MVYSESEWDNMDKTTENSYIRNLEFASRQIKEEEKDNTRIWICKVLGNASEVFYYQKDKEHAHPKISYPVEIVYPLKSAGTRFDAVCSLEKSQEYKYSCDDEVIVFLKRKRENPTDEWSYFYDIYCRTLAKLKAASAAAFED